jgi:hypothetical protein
MQSPATATTPQAVTVEIPVGPTRPITDAEMQIIRRQRSEMSNQLSSAQNRREDLLDEMRSAPAGTEQGLQQQFQVLNDRIVAIEKDIEASGRTLRTGQVPVGIVIVPPRSFGTLSPEAAAARGAAMSAMILIPVLFVYMIARWRRRRRGGATSTYSAEHDTRMERLEQAVDAVAIEVERVGEAQRYQTKLLAEANIMPALNVAQRAAEPVRAREYEESRDR